ncbi:hypothetical protein SNE40_020752 [Patella caerulea]|uniref:Uncharacterized protein n=1 Tax=Patella caerulea TaxID=87958 RepID=A0AAN8J5P5_PATCE
MANGGVPNANFTTTSLSGIEPPPKFLEKPGLTPLAWNEWKQLYDTYAEAIGTEEFTLKRQTAILLNSLGMEGQRRYHKLPELQTYPVDTNDFTKAILKLQKEFKIKQNILTERFKFRKCSQLQEQTITEYIATLRDLASLCEFNDPDDAIPDQFI